MSDAGILSGTEYAVEFLPELWFGVVIFALGGYLLLDGFDFGIGVLFAEADEDDRERMLAAFGPVWKANEVWLVFFGTVLFAGFPAVYANLLSRHYLLAFAILLGLGLRGLGAKLREESDDERWTRFWDGCFVAGSLGSPVLLGMLVGAWILGEPSAIAIGPIAVGLTVLALTIALGGAYLGLKTDGQLRDRVVHRSQLAIGGYVLLLVATAAGIYAFYPDLRPTLVSVPTAIVVLVTVLAAVGGIYGGRTGRYRGLFAAVAAIAIALVALVAHLLYPWVDPAAGLAIRDAVVSPLPLNLASAVAAVFIPVIVVYFAFLYSLFRGAIEPSEGYA